MATLSISLQGWENRHNDCVPSHTFFILVWGLTINIAGHAIPIFLIDLRCHPQRKSQLYLRHDNISNFSKSTIIFISREPLTLCMKLKLTGKRWVHSNRVTKRQYSEPLSYCCLWHNVVKSLCTTSNARQMFYWCACPKIWLDLGWFIVFLKLYSYTLLPWLMKHYPDNVNRWPQYMKMARSSIYEHLLSLIICWGHVSLVCPLE